MHRLCGHSIIVVYASSSSTLLLRHHCGTCLLVQEMLRGSFVEGDTVAVTVASGSDGRATGLAFCRAAAGVFLPSVIIGLASVYCS